MDIESLERSTVPIRLITSNLRYAAKKTLLPNEQPWEVRCPRLASQLRVHTFGQANAFICMQEVQHQQLVDMQAKLGLQWGQVGRARADGLKDGEFSPIFYRMDHWAVERTETYWLSPTPTVPSSAWGTTINRIVTVGLFRHRTFGNSIIVMNTHLDHKSSEARAESAKLLLKIAREWQREASTEQADSPPVFLAGDFNSGRDEEPHRLLTAQPDGLVNISDLLPESQHYGNRITYTTFGEGEPTTIDHLFVLDPTGINFHNFAVLSNRFDDGIYYSDHRPVLADVEVFVSRSS
ncbi:hypothetical protein CCHL11_03257 [Colletotrichum chlorophyti]|uniref:Endonuclease/exonuclease/phosphatase domain-containing protein n=1 Tax=Colletotrichum chlorophyti TaxID=708187 RepID=A0A1Q8S3S1_9PEZI|nr:hypothetical protein CCHL11_03257 [Colletotrichum chlorophyti]